MDEKTGPPALVDYSQAAVGRAVATTTANLPITVYPAATGIAGLAAGVLLVAPWAFYGGLGVLALGIGSFIVNYFFRYESFAQHYLAELRETQQEYLAAFPDRLRREFEALDFEDGAQQLAALEEQYERLKTVLGQQLQPTELTYARYLGTAEQVYLAALDTLESAARQLRSIEHIDTARLEAELARATSEGEREALTKRLTLITDVKRGVDAIIAYSEKAVTVLTETTIAIARIETKVGRASMDYETAIDELARLASRAGIYDKRNMQQ